MKTEFPHAKKSQERKDSFPEAKELLASDIAHLWDVSSFNKERWPYKVGDVEKSVLDSQKPNVLDMPIKLPGGDMRIPLSDDVKKIVQQCFEFEKSINPRWEEYYCYLTINQGWVEPHTTQRTPGAHFDGMQGVKFAGCPLNACHSYLVSNGLVTRFYIHPFDFAVLDPAIHNYFKRCEELKDPAHSFQPDPYELVLQTAYSVHESVPAQARTFRTFVRVEFSLKKFNRLGNSLNSLIDTSDWHYEPQPIPNSLI